LHYEFLMKGLNIDDINTEQFYMKQPKDSVICFPVALHNALLYKGRKPPRIEKLIKLCGTTETGTWLPNLPSKVFKKFGLILSTDAKEIILKGGILILNGKDIIVKGETRDTSHAIFCTRVLHNGEFVCKCVNLGSKWDTTVLFREEDILEDVREKDIKGHKGYYLK